MPIPLASLLVSAAPAAGAAGGTAAGLLLWFLAKSQVHGRLALLLRFLAAIAGAWTAVCLAYWFQAGQLTFGRYLAASTLATAVLAGAGVVLYAAALITFEPGERQWRRSSALLAAATLMGAAFLRAAYEPVAILPIQMSLAAIVITTVWRFRAELLVYLAILGVAVAAVLGARQYFASRTEIDMVVWTTSAASGVSLAMVLAAAILGFKRRQEFNVKWYRQGLLIVPLVVSSLAATSAGFVAVWSGATWHTVWALGAWWAVLLISSVGLNQPDLFGFSSVGAGLAAIGTFAVLGGDRTSGYWGRYPSVLCAMAFGAAVLSGLLALNRNRPGPARFARALYFAALAIVAAGVLIEPLETQPQYIGAALLIASAVLALAHAHRAPAWVNYLVAGLATAGVAALGNPGAPGPEAERHQRFIQIAAAMAVGWLVVALVLRESLRHLTSDRTARRQSEPFTVFGMATTLVLAGYLSVQQVRAYAERLIDGASPTAIVLGPLWGLIGWLAVLLAFLLSMWLVRHTARTFLFYCFGILATAYLGLFSHTQDLYAYLIYAVGGYGAAHLIVYLYEAKFMALLARVSHLYREERRASTTIFTLAVFSCFIGAILTNFRLHLTASLIMLMIMAAVFLAWSFVWLRGEMLYPAVVMVTLAILAVWHNKVHPTAWDPHRINMNAAVVTFSALAWLGVGNRLRAIRGEIFQLAGPARACSVILALLGTGFAAALALSPTFASDVWRQPREVGDWALGLTTLAALVVYFTWARFEFGRRFFDVMGGIAIALLSLYVGIYWGIRI
ncbi:MAG: hypothetical protein NTX40_05885 [Planctomycetota bacterium]|nr:hypothetical protein [Planctomycetota bacterium]